MEKIKLQENLYVYRQTNEPGIIANTYVLIGNPNILIDAGFMVEEKIGKVLLTHCHFDHHQYAKKYQEKGAKILASKKATEELKKASQIVSPDYFRKKFNAKIESITVDEILEENQAINNGNFKLKIIYVPGHTPGSIAFYDEEKKMFFSGDTWYGGERIGSYKFPSGDLEQLKISVEKLKNLKPKFLFPGH